MQFPPRNWSLQPVAAEAVVEVTKLPRPLDRVTLGDSASTQTGTLVSAEHASRRVMWWADRVFAPRRRLPLGDMSDSTQRSRRGNGASMRGQGNRTQHGKPRRVVFAYRRCRQKGGAPGVDGERFADIEAYGVERWLGELTEELRKKTYRSQAFLRVWIPKPDGTKRPLGIPTVRDCVVQTAVVLVLESIFEADLPIVLSEARSAAPAGDSSCFGGPSIARASRSDSKAGSAEKSRSGIVAMNMDCNVR